MIHLKSTKILMATLLCVLSIHHLAEAKAEGRPTIGIYPVQITASVKKHIATRNQEEKSSLQRVRDALTQQIITGMRDADVFTVKTQDDLSTQDQNGQNTRSIIRAFKNIGCKYAVIVTVIGFNSQRTPLHGTNGGIVLKPKYPISIAVEIMIYDTTTSRWLTGLTVPHFQGNVAYSGKSNEEHKARQVRDIAQEAVFRVIYAIFPEKILAKIREEQKYNQIGSNNSGDNLRTHGEFDIKSDYKLLKDLTPKKNTWIVIHGRATDRNAFYIKILVKSLMSRPEREVSQVLTLDWRSGSKADDSVSSKQKRKWWEIPIPTLGGAAAIPILAQVYAETLDKHGFKPSQVNFIGHSWGAALAAEIAKAWKVQTGKDVNTIIALDSATHSSIIGSDYDSRNVNFKTHTRYSWAFRADSMGVDYGSEDSALTADETFKVKFKGLDGISTDEHNGVAYLFANIIARIKMPATLGRSENLWNKVGLGKAKIGDATEHLSIAALLYGRIKGLSLPWEIKEDGYEATLYVTGRETDAKITSISATWGTFKQTQKISQDDDLEIQGESKGSDALHGLLD